MTPRPLIQFHVHRVCPLLKENNGSREVVVAVVVYGQLKNNSNKSVKTVLFLFAKHENMHHRARAFKSVQKTSNSKIRGKPTDERR